MHNHDMRFYIMKRVYYFAENSVEESTEFDNIARVHIDKYIKYTL